MKRILVVHPNQDVCYSLSDMLREFGFEVGITDTTPEAVQVLMECDRDPDFIIMAHEMPALEGMYLRDIIAQDQQWSKIRVLTITEDNIVFAEVKGTETGFPQGSLAASVVSALLS